jgi:hypothetical protein
MVEYQCGVSDMIQSIAAKLWVSARTMRAGPASGAGGPTPRDPRRVLAARAEVIEDGDQGPDPEIERRPDQEERHVEERRLPPKQRIVLGRPRNGPRVEMVQTEEQRRNRTAITGIMAKVVSPDPAQHDPPSSLGRVLNQHEEQRAKRERHEEQERHEPREEELFGVRRSQKSRRPRLPAGRSRAPTSGSRFHGCPGGIAACSGRSAT